MSRKRSAERERRRQERAARRALGGGGETPDAGGELDSQSAGDASESAAERSLDRGESPQPEGVEVRWDLADTGDEARVGDVTIAEAGHPVASVAARHAPRAGESPRPNLEVARAAPSNRSAVDPDESSPDRRVEPPTPETPPRSRAAAVADVAEGAAAKPAATARRRRAPVAEPREGVDSGRADDRIQRTVRLSRGVDAMIRALAQHRGIDLNAAISVAIAADFDRVFGPPPRPEDP